jgi:CHAT domain-containing protein
MVSFYAHVANGEDKAALAEARAETRAQFPHPCCWAPFILVGDR